MRVLAWFSCGAASAVAAKVALDAYRGAVPVEVVNCDTLQSEHPDNLRFLRDVEKWIGQPVLQIRSHRYVTVDDVFEKTRYMAGINGARCTTEMKKVPRFEFQEPDDIHVFGFTAGEEKRSERLLAANPELTCDFVLQTHDITKDDCFKALDRAGIQRPAMYGLGYRNNNCIGCVKATSARYWQMIRRDFPDVFERRVKQSRDLGVRLTRVRGRRVFIDEIPEDYLAPEPLEDISCGPECQGRPQEREGGREP